MTTYEITVEIANGDWHWKREEYTNFHAAAADGLDYAFVKRARLIGIQAIDAKFYNEADKARRLALALPVTE